MPWASIAFLNVMPNVNHDLPVATGQDPRAPEQVTPVADVAIRKQVEEALLRSQEQLAGIIESAMDAIITIDEKQQVVLFNGAAERMFATTSDEAMGRSLDRFIPERFRPAHSAHIQAFGDTHVTRRSMGALGALFGVRSDGEEFPIEASISQIDSGGQKFYTVILRDITERKLAQDAIELREEQFRTMVNSIPQLAWMAEADGSIFWADRPLLGPYQRTSAKDRCSSRRGVDALIAE